MAFLITNKYLYRDIMQTLVCPFHDYFKTNAETAILYLLKFLKLEGVFTIKVKYVWGIPGL